MEASSRAPKTPIPTNPLRRTAWVQGELKCRGLSFRMLGKLKGITGNSLAQAMWKPSIRAEAIIAEALGLDPVQIWPERFDRETGERLHRVMQRTSAAKRRNNKGPVNAPTTEAA